MNDREPKAEETPAVKGLHDALEERLQAMYAALYPPAFPSVKPSSALQRRVAEITTRLPARTARPSFAAWFSGWWRCVLVGWKVASGGALAGAVLLALLGLALVPPKDHGAP